MIIVGNFVHASAQKIEDTGALGMLLREANIPRQNPYVAQVAEHRQMGSFQNSENKAR